MNLFLTITTALVLATSSAIAQPGHRATLREGNDHYHAGAYEAAIEAYAKAGDQDPLALFNRACALQRLGRLEEAERLLRRVDAMAHGENLTALVRYNLGSAAVEQARSLAGDGLREPAIEAYRRAVQLFRDAHRIAPDDAESARNIEVAGREAKRLIEQLRAEQEARRQLAEQLQDLQNEQQRESESNQNDASSADQQAPQPPPDPQAGDQPADPSGESDQPDGDSPAPNPAQRQQELTDGTRAAQNELQKLQDQTQQSNQGSPSSSGTNDPLERAAQDLKQAIEMQQSAEEALEQGDPQAAAERQREAAERLDDARRALSGTSEEGTPSERREPNDPDPESADSDPAADSEHTAETPQNAGDEHAESDQQGTGEAGRAGASDGGSGATADEATSPLDRLADQLLDKEQRDRERLQRLRLLDRARSTPVEKDW